MGSRRLGVFAAGCLVLVAGWRWTLSGLDPVLYRYDIASLFSMGRGEAVFYARYVVTAAVAAVLLGRGADPIAAAALRRAERLPFLRALAFLAVIAAAAAWIVSRTVLRDQVITDDEYVYLFQARVLASGHLVAASPELPQFFDNVFVRAGENGWFGQYPPGHPLMLVPGVVLGVPRLVPVLLCGLNVFLTGLLLRRLLGAAWALAGAVLLLATPFFLLTGATYLSHSTAYAGLALGTLGAHHAVRGGRAAWGAAAGLGIGITLLARPWTGLVLGAFPAAFLLWGAAARRRRLSFVLFAATVAGAAALFLAANAHVSGSPWRTGYDAVRSGGEREFGFGTVVAGVHTHTPGQGLINAGILAVRFIVWTLAWAFPAWLAVGRSRSGNAPSPPAPSALSGRAPAWGAAGMILAGLLSYVPYWAPGVNDTGPLKTYELLLPLGVLITMAAKHGGPLRAGWAPAALVAAALLFWPVQVRHLRDLTARVRAPLAAVERTVRPPALVFTANVQAPRPGSWVFGRPNPEPDLSDAIVYVRDLGPRNDALRRAHPERRAYRLDVREDGPRVQPLGREARER